MNAHRLPAAATATDPVTELAQWLDRAHLLSQGCASGDDGDKDEAWLVWARVQFDRGELAGVQRQLLESLPEPVRAVWSRPWVRRYLELATRDADGKPLSGGWRTQWLSRQRRDHAEGALPPGRQWLLSRLDGFSWDPGQARWQTSFDEVAEFVVENGRLPTRGDDRRLSNWLAAQRFALRSDRLRFDRAQALSRLPGWSLGLASTRSRQPWERRCEQLRGFIETFRRYPFSDAEDPAEAELARWVTAQREQLRRDGLSSYRIAALSSLPDWRWAARDAAWDARFEELRAGANHGTIGTDHPLYSWIVAQRRRHRDGRLAADQVRRLQSLNLLGARVSHAA